MAVSNTSLQALAAEYGNSVVEDHTRREIRAAWLLDEDRAVDALLEGVGWDRRCRQTVQTRAASLVQALRRKQDQQSPLDAFMREYDLSSQEGVLLMCVAEALLRIPDHKTAEKLIEDKLGGANWSAHVGKSASLMVNASTWGLMLTGRVIQLDQAGEKDPLKPLKRLVGRSGEPVIRLAIRQAMRIMGHQFVMGRTIQAALTRSGKKSQQKWRHSFDMLGEAALTEADAQRYLAAYRQAIAEIGAGQANPDIFAAPGISVKLSALFPRYEYAQRDRVLAVVPGRLRELACLARTHAIALTVDAEECDRLDISLDLFERVLRDTSMDAYDGLGLAVQAYQKRALKVIEWLARLAEDSQHQIPIRLVKGAYWDSEIKHAQELGLPGYPVYTRKAATDASYLFCAQRLFAHDDLFFPQFATHNAHTIAAVAWLAESAGRRGKYEFQRLHGMGAQLYDCVRGMPDFGESIACRVYAPVGSHEDLLPYLVRRLLENGANTSFVNRISDSNVPIDELVADPIAALAALKSRRHPGIPVPTDLFQPTRKNSLGINLADDTEAIRLYQDMADRAQTDLQATPILANQAAMGKATPVRNPADTRDVIGAWSDTPAESVAQAVASACAFHPTWDRMPVARRAGLLEKAADEFESRAPEFVALCSREAGKTIADGVGEVREAVDFLRYYAAMARAKLQDPMLLAGPTGEENTLSWHGRGVFVCISPWNFPLAIFVGQISAALVAGNCVLAKPAGQTSLVAYRATQVLHAAGIPLPALQLLPGSGAATGSLLCADPRVAGVAFTGSTQTAQTINRTLAARNAPLATVIAETGGLNAMIADSSALPEQVVKDVMTAAFGSAGQRCSACRVLFVQADVADRIIAMLAGAMDELRIGDPLRLGTDVGPVIDVDAVQTLTQHADRMRKEGRVVKILELPPGCEHGHFFAPHAFELEHLGQLHGETFGPILHIIRYRAKQLDTVIDSINATGYGLTLGIHTRVDATRDTIQRRVHVGNCYCNRNQIGAMVGCQPFGGEGLSGTGPKAGGPHYLYRFATERVRTVNTAAVGGNASLLSLAGRHDEKDT